MIRFNNDYNCGAHPKILEALAATNTESYGGYGLDPWCERAADEIRKYLDCPNALIHFMVGGTQTNYTVISALLRPYQSVISADSGHIHVHETGAVEHCGHKIHALPHTDGKITAAQIAAEAELYCTSGVQEHITQPKLVYLSYPTEYGTIYSRQELEAIHDVCRRYGLYLFIDGARLGYGLGARDADVTMADLARLADVFYCGGTKCGALFGEAVVFANPTLGTDFRSYIKQNGAMLAKGWLLGLQFYTLFHDGLYFEITKKADEYAMQIREAFAEKSVPFYIDSSTNQQFVILEDRVLEKLGEKYVYEYEMRIDKTHSCVRFCTSWSTTKDEVLELVRDIREMQL
jgi:threonine aldolase